MKCIPCKNNPDPTTGYGRKWNNGRLIYEHRLSFINAYPEIDISDKIVHHTCKNPACINPKHLVAITRKQHSDEHELSGWAKIHAAKTHCIKGHPFDKHNGRQRYCSICMKEYKKNWAREHYEERKEHINLLRRKRRANNKVIINICRKKAYLG
jgi:hypothetical protein